MNPSKVFLAALVIFATCVGTFAEETSRWHSGTRHDYKIDGRDAIVVVPDSCAALKPWIWRPAFFGAFASVDSALLAKGWHIAYYDVTHCYGSDPSVAWAKDFYDDAVERFGLNRKVAVEGFSRGGYFCFAWAEKYPETVASLYLDAPVCDIFSWPGRERQPELWKDFLENWGLSDDAVGDDFRGNALQRLPAIARHKIPIIAVCGGADTVVPYEDNFEKVRRRYQELGGPVELILKPECGHHPHSLSDPEPVVDFLVRYAPGYTVRQNIRRRGTLDNSLRAMTVGRKACVAFLGGSITEMKGWRDMMESDLRQRFPETEFNFIEAGIASLGSTPHAMRFENDVLSKGTPDLLFVEAAVNDDTNEFSAKAQVRAMEGIVRHALAANPKMDIVILDFIYDPFLPMMDEGRMPDVVYNHERVADRYGLSSINYISEIHSRISAGELTWEQFGGTHPLWEGHKYYAAAINRLIDLQTKPADSYEVADHPVPEAIDAASYSGGKFVSLKAARKLRKCRIVRSWHPTDEASVRDGFVDVPMLVCRGGGSFSLDFEGDAVGIFCVAGPASGVLEYRIDDGEWLSIDTHTKWSRTLYIPWVYMLADALPNGRHSLELRCHEGSECIIRNFVVNSREPFAEKV